YAVLALFVLYVAPRQLAAFRARGRGDIAQQTLAGTIALGCWVVVFLMVFYIWRFWPPRTVYLGTLGTHPPEVQFFTQSPQLYVSWRRAGNADRRRWEYVIVTDTGALQSNDRFDFTYQWGSQPDDYKDFGLQATALKGGHIDLSPGSEPGTLMYHEDGD